MKNIFLAAIFLLLFFACHIDESEVASLDDVPVSSLPVNHIMMEQKLIKKADLKFKVEDIDTKRHQLKQAARKYHAYISNESRTNYSNETSETLTVKVPSQYFDSLLTSISVIVSDFERKDITVKDVTNEYIDLEARINNKHRLEMRFLHLLDNSTTISEMMVVEKKIAEVREEVERAEGKLQYLKRQVSYSQIDLEYYRRYDVTQTFGEEISTGFINGWDYLKWSFIGLSNIWPFLLLIVVIWLLVNEKKKIRIIRQ